MVSGEIESLSVNIYGHNRRAHCGSNLHSESSHATGTNDHGYILWPQFRSPDGFIRSSYRVGNNG